MTKPALGIGLFGSSRRGSASPGPRFNAKTLLAQRLGTASALLPKRADSGL